MKNEEITEQQETKKEILFRCSSLGKIMTDPRGKSNLQKFNEEKAKFKKYQEEYNGTANKETKTAKKKREQMDKALEKMRELEEVKDEVTLSATCKKELRAIMIDHKYNRRKRIESKYLTKGIECEEAGITLYAKFKHKNYKNNKVRKENDFLTGEYDRDWETCGLS